MEVCEEICDFWQTWNRNDYIVQLTRTEKQSISFEYGKQLYGYIDTVYLQCHNWQIKSITI